MNDVNKFKVGDVVSAYKLRKAVKLDGANQKGV